MCNKGDILLEMIQQACLFNYTGSWTGQSNNNIESKPVCKLNVLYLDPVDLWEMLQRTWGQNPRTNYWNRKDSLPKSGTQMYVLYIKSSVWNR